MKNAMMNGRTARHTTPHPCTAAARRGRLSLAGVLVGVLVAVALPVARAQTASAPFMLGIDSDETQFSGKWLRRIYREAFRRLGTPVAFSHQPSRRIMALMDEGALDGDVLRVQAYAQAHPNQLRVEEPVMVVTFSLYTADPSLRLPRLEDMTGSNLLGEYRRGVAICENTLKRFLPPASVSDVTTADQGIKKLLSRRTDVFCDNDVSILTELLTPTFKDAKGVRRLVDIGSPLALYPYLHQRHAAMAPRFAAVLKGMKAEGLIERYRLESERELAEARP